MAIDSLTADAVKALLVDDDPSDNDVRSGLRNLSNQVDETQVLLSNITDDTKLPILNDTIATADEINLTADITATGDELDLLSGSFGQEDLNKVDGITASTDELNIVADSEVTEENLDTLVGLTESPAEIAESLNYARYSTQIVEDGDEVELRRPLNLAVFHSELGSDDKEVTFNFTADDARIGELVFLVVNTAGNGVVSGTFTFNYTNHVGSEVSITTQSPIVRRFFRVAQGYVISTPSGQIIW